MEESNGSAGAGEAEAQPGPADRPPIPGPRDPAPLRSPAAAASAGSGAPAGSGGPGGSGAPATPGAPGVKDRARLGLNGLNFFLAATQTGFGPFIPVFLTGLTWSQTGIGFALSIGTLAAIASQLPAGALVDAVHDKRAITALALALTGLSALLLAAWPRPGAGFVAQIVTAHPPGRSPSGCGQNCA